jgi:large subunit ribosomal protein L25
MTVQLTAEPRTVVGKQVRALRRDGLIPAVIYGKRDPINVQLPIHATTLTLRDSAENDVYDLNVSGKSYKVLLRDVQKHVTRADIMHIDFLEVSMTDMIRAEAPIHLVGKSPLTGGVVGLLLHAVEIEAHPDELVSQFELDVALIVDEDTILHVRDLPVPAGVVILTDGDTPVAKFNALRTAAQADADVAGGTSEASDATVLEG